MANKKAFIKRSRLNSDLREFLLTELIPAPNQHDNVGFVCPACGSGTHREEYSTGAVSIFRGWDDGSLMWHCNCCNKGGDIVDYVMYKMNIPKKDACRYVISEYGDKPVSEATPLSSEANRIQHTKGKSDQLGTTALSRTTVTSSDGSYPRHDFTNYMAKHPLLVGSYGYQYLQRRGLTDETIRKFKLGFDSRIVKYTDKYGRRIFGSAIIIPFLDDETGTIPYVIARFTDNDVSMRYKNSRKAEAGGTPVFHPESLYTDTGEPCFITEGALDTISIIQVGGESVALNGTGNSGKLIEALRKRPTKSKLIICLDNDGNEATERSARELTERFQAMGVSAVCDNSVCGDYKDPNEHLVADPAGFKAAVQAKIAAFQLPKS